MSRSVNSRKPLQVKRIIKVAWPFILGLLVFISTRFAISHSSVVDRYYSGGLYPLIAESFSFLSNIVPFSIWDVFWIIFFLLIISGLILACFRKVRFTWYVIRTFQLLALLYSYFYIVWGYNYFRSGIQERIGWKTPESSELVFRTVLDSLIVQTNSNYISVSSSDFASIDKLVEQSYREQSPGLGIRYPNGKRRPKKMLFSAFYAKLGLSGYFGPFFNEIHVNECLLPMDYPFILGHEKAHQFGFTSEAEANLAGFVICVKSGDQRLKYSGYLTLMLYFLRDASHTSGYRQYLSKIDKSVLNDIRFRQKYYDSLQNNALSDIQTAANNSYLKANNIEKGVRNYNQVVSLVISWYYNSKNY
jgi:hypothetical protein